ncbi:hypothetical protein [Pontibacter oryzae]|uniref:Uncharacterized protein n=1 Tax=Pontibacter oryzae TaxID=2304593 RepID=A0A399SKR5_9BACT|nr:hypothetical protein [Pontibacter oryzae]RIJ42537.1 hypothetical protein D1627_01355 [Pontibacter oryzae]
MMDKSLISHKQLLWLLVFLLLPLASFAEGGVKAIGALTELFVYLIWFLAFISLLLSLIWGKKHSEARVIVYLLCGFSFLTWWIGSFFLGGALSASYNLANLVSLGILVMTRVRKESKAPSRHT